MLVLQGYIIVPAVDLDRVKDELVRHQQLTREESGCVTFLVTADETQPNKFSVYEEFVDQAAFDHHQARVKSSKWGEVTRNVERYYQITHGIA